MFKKTMSLRVQYGYNFMNSIQIYSFRPTKISEETYKHFVETENWKNKFYIERECKKKENVAINISPNN